MKIDYIKIADLKPYALNAKKHPQSQLEGMAESIKRFGFTQPVVVDSKNEIIIGHGRVEGAKIAGLKALPCIKRDDLSVQEIKALRIIDNRISETGWDNELLKLEFDELDFDLSVFNVDFKEFNFSGEVETKEEKEVVDQQQFMIVIDCESEAVQQQFFDEFKSRGIECRLIM